MFRSLLVGAAVAAAAAAIVPAARASAVPHQSNDALAQKVAAAVDSRYPGLRVTEASSTSVIDSLTLFDAGDPRVVPADNGIYFAVCPDGATCPFPGRAARAVAAFAPRSLALELAVRTFDETSADLVVVSLPTRSFVLLVFERETFGAPTRWSLRIHGVVDAETVTRLYRPFGLAPTPDGRDSLLAARLNPPRR